MTKSQKQSIDFKPVFDYVDRRISESEKKLMEQLDEKTSNLPTKKDYFETMDALMKEIKAAREDLAAHKVDHETTDEDIKGLKKNVNNLYEKLDLDQPIPQPAY